MIRYFIASLSLCCASDLGHAADAKRLFTVRDAIEATRPIDPSVNDTTPALRAPKVSPDGRRFFVMTVRGILETNQSEYQLRVFDVGEGSAPVRETVAATLRTLTNWPGILAPAWVGNDRIAFRGASALEMPQVYFANVAGGLAKRTAAPSGVQAFATNLEGDLLYLTIAEPDQKALDDAMAGGYVVEPELTALDLYTEVWKNRVVPQHAQLLHLAAGSESPINIANIPIQPNVSRIVRMWMAPNGRQAVMLMPTIDYLAQWQGYEVPAIKDHVTRGLQYFHGRKRNPSSRVPASWAYPQYFRVDLVKRDMRPLVVAPAFLWTYSGQPNAVWSPTGNSIVVVNCMFPIARLDEIAPPKRDLALKYPAVLEVDLETDRVRPVTFLTKENTELSALTWGNDGRRIEMDVSDRLHDERRHVVFVREGDSWRQYSAEPLDSSKVSSGYASLLQGRIEAGVEQNVNLPPRIVVRRKGSDNPTHVVPLNPQLDKIQLSPTETINWTDSVGSTWSGGLMYPTDYQSGRRYPFAILTHGYNPDEFLFDSQMYAGDRPGSFSGMSARALSAKGYVVLQEYGKNDHAWPRYYTPDEALQFIRSYRSVIGMLADRGLIDPGKVGIIGFSRTSYHVKYLLVHADFPIAAAAVTDGWDFGYFQMMLSDNAHKAKGVYGTMPVGEGLQPWIKDAPTFNADRVRAPLRIEAIDPISVPAEYEMYAALKLVGVPTELTVYPDGVHRLAKPREKYRSQQANIDWFEFWIQGREDADPAKAEQYERWRALRDSWKRPQPTGR